MTRTEFKRIQKIVEIRGSYVIDNGDGTSTEICKNGPYDYAIYNCWACHRDCFAVTNSLARLSYIFID